MADNVSELIRRTQQRGQAAAAPAPSGARGPEPEDEGEDKYLAYAKLRGMRQTAFMLEFRLATGDSESLDYGWLCRARFDLSKGLVLHFRGVTVTVKGRKLLPLYLAIRDHRATWVQELANPPAEAVRDPDETLVTSIEIDPD